MSRTVGARPGTPDRLARLPLRAELYLVAHDDDRGGPHVHPQTLAVGLAGAILLELWLAGRVFPGWRFDAHAGQWRPWPGHLAVADPAGIGDPLADAALAAVRHTHRGSPPDHQLRDWLRHFAATDVYERVRANMVAAGMLRRGSRRRYGLARTECYLVVDPAWAVRARARLRAAAGWHADPYRLPSQEPDRQCVALCGLVDVLELVPFLYAPDVTAPGFRNWLGPLLHRHDRAVREVIGAVDAGRGDLAVSAMR
jgi:hypothetical protein